MVNNARLNQPHQTARKKGGAVIVVGGTFVFIFLVVGAIFFLTDIVGQSRQNRRERDRREQRRQSWEKGVEEP